MDWVVFYSLLPLLGVSFCFEVLKSKEGRFLCPNFSFTLLSRKLLTAETGSCSLYFPMLFIVFEYEFGDGGMLLLTKFLYYLIIELRLFPNSSSILLSPF